MSAWADYCAKPAPVMKVGGNVVAMRALSNPTMSRHVRSGSPGKSRHL
jgi:hypothetical protein